MALSRVPVGLCIPPLVPDGFPAQSLLAGHRQSTSRPCLLGEIVSAFAGWQGQFGDTFLTSNVGGSPTLIPIFPGPSAAGPPQSV